MSKLQLLISAGRYRNHTSIIRRCLPAAHSLLQSPLVELSIALVGDRLMSQLHEQFMNIAGPTDVLTFPLETDRRGRSLSGEVIVCVPEARRQAATSGVPLENEVLLYALHGLLHLSGFDDTTPRGYAAMHRMEDRLLTALKIGPVFDLNGPSKRGKSIETRTRSTA